MTWPAAVLWDMDGTLIDSERAWLDAAEALAAASGTELVRADLDRLVGASMSTTATVLREVGVHGSPTEIIDALTTRVGASLESELTFRPGALELAVDIHSAGIPQAIVTMSNRAIASGVAAELPVPMAVIAGDDVVHGKPHPESYLTAASLLGVDIADCVVIEDSATGLAAGVASGAVTIAAPFYLPIDATLATTEWGDLVGRSLLDVRALRSTLHSVVHATQEN